MNNVMEDYVDPNKVVLTVRARNVPVAAAADATTGSTANPTGSNDAICVSSLDVEDNDRIDVFERAAPSVVNIDTFVEAKDSFSANLLDIPVGTGSGFVWDDKGHIVTNYHVIRTMRTINVAMLVKSPSSSSSSPPTTDTADDNSKEDQLVEYRRKVYVAKVVGVDPNKDLAVLKIDAPKEDLYPIQVGTSHGLKVGQTAYAIGNPFGLDHTLTTGVISGLHRTVKSPTGRPITGIIQTDASINPGNSGGPLLLASSGKLIGINTSIYSPSGASAGIGFAIPIEDGIVKLINILIKDGKVVRPILGIRLMDGRQARVLLGASVPGVLVLDVPLDSPAAKGGMRGTRRNIEDGGGSIEIGDLIVELGGYSVTGEADLFDALERCKAGDDVDVVVKRSSGRSRTLREGNEEKREKGGGMVRKTLRVKLQGSDDQAKFFESLSSSSSSPSEQQSPQRKLQM